MTDSAKLQDWDRRAVLAGAGAAFAALAAPPAFANLQDAALYDPAPPADSAYIRVIAGAPAAAIAIGAAAFPASEGARIHPYRILPAGDHPIDGAGGGAAALQAGASYSYLTGGPAGDRLIRDDIVSDPAKCGLMLYNLSAASAARLYVPGRDIEILAGVPAGAQKTRAVNAVTVDLAVGADAAEAGRFPAVKLQRRAHITFLAWGSPGAYGAAMAMNSLA